MSNSHATPYALLFQSYQDCCRDACRKSVHPITLLEERLRANVKGRPDSIYAFSNIGLHDVIVNKFCKDYFVTGDSNSQFWYYLAGFPVRAFFKNGFIDKEVIRSIVTGFVNYLTLDLAVIDYVADRSHKFVEWEKTIIDFVKLIEKANKISFLKSLKCFENNEDFVSLYTYDDEF